MFVACCVSTSLICASSFGSGAAYPDLHIVFCFADLARLLPLPDIFLHNRRVVKIVVAAFQTNGHVVAIADNSFAAFALARVALYRTAFFRTSSTRTVNSFEVKRAFDTQVDRTGPRFTPQFEVGTFRERNVCSGIVFLQDIHEKVSHRIVCCRGTLNLEIINTILNNLWRNFFKLFKNLLEIFYT